MVRSKAPAGTGSGTLSADEGHTQIPSGGIGAPTNVALTRLNPADRLPFDREPQTISAPHCRSACAARRFLSRCPSAKIT